MEDYLKALMPNFRLLLTACWLRARRCRALAARTAAAEPNVGLSPCGAAVVAP